MLHRPRNRIPTIIPLLLAGCGGDPVVSPPDGPATIDAGIDADVSMQRAFCETQSVVYCNGLEGANPPESDPTVFLMDPFSSGRQTTTYLAQGYSNPRILGTGAFRFAMHDGGEDDTGVSFPGGAPVKLPVQMKVGFVFRLGPNYLAPNPRACPGPSAGPTPTARPWRAPPWTATWTSTSCAFTTRTWVHRPASSIDASRARLLTAHE